MSPSSRAAASRLASPLAASATTPAGCHCTKRALCRATTPAEGPSSAGRGRLAPRSRWPPGIEAAGATTTLPDVLDGCAYMPIKGEHACSAAGTPGGETPPCKNAGPASAQRGFGSKPRPIVILLVRLLDCWEEVRAQELGPGSQRCLRSLQAPAGPGSVPGRVGDGSEAISRLAITHPCPRLERAQCPL